MVDITEQENLKADLEHSFRTMNNCRATFPPQKPSDMESRAGVFQICPTVQGAEQFTAREQSRMQSCLPQLWLSHFQPFPFPPEEQWRDVPSEENDLSAASAVKGMITVDTNTGTKAAARFDYLHTSLTLDVAGLIIYVETTCGACSDVQIIIDDTRVHVLALREETKTADVNGPCDYTEVTDMGEAYSCYVLRHYCRTFHLPHPIEQEGASIQQENNVMRIFIPWK